MESVRKSFQLSIGVCDEVPELINDFCLRVRVKREDTVRCRLVAEDCLVHWLGNGLEGSELTLLMGTRLRTPFVTLELKGPQDDPTSVRDEEFGLFIDGVMVNLGLEPEYSFSRGRNCVTFMLRRKPRKQLAALAFALANATVVGFLGMLVLPDDVRETLLTGILQPMNDAFFHILTCLAGPMVFLSVVWGIYGIGDMETLGRIGKRLLLRYLRVGILAGCCAMPLFLLLGPDLSGASGAGTKLSSIADMVFGIIPSNIVEPFYTGNTLQIIFLAVVVALGLLCLGRRTDVVAKIVDQTNALVGFLMGIVGKFVPLLIALVVIDMIWAGKLSAVAGIWKLVVVLLAALIAMGVAFVLLTSFRRKVSPLLLAKKCLPAFAIALSTASSMATFGTSVKTLEERLGVDHSLTSFGLPLGIVMQRSAGTVYLLLDMFYFANQYDVACDPTWLVTALFICWVMAVATPPIPGGGTVVLTMLFAQLGIPEEALGIAMALEVVTDFPVTAFEQLGILTTLTNVSAELNMLDEDVLRSEAG